MKKKHKILMGLGILIVAGIIYVSVYGLISISTDSSRVLFWCEENNISSCYVRTPECFYDCQKLELDFFKLNVDTGLFNGAECYCELNSSIQKIW